MKAIALPSVAAIAAASIAVAVVACSKSPTGPDTRFLQPPGVYVERVDINGPDSVAPGETVRFTAIAHRSDGSSENVTSTALWKSSDTAVLSFSSPGEAIGRERGDVAVTVGHGPASARKDIVVTPQGTYRLWGVVTESGAPTVRLPGVRVEVIGGAAAGLAAETGESGEYRLYGLAGETRLRVTKDAYEAEEITILLAAHEKVTHELRLARAPIQLLGAYTLTITAANDCRDALPADVHTRTYGATVTQTGSQFRVRLSGAKFAAVSGKTGDSFSGVSRADVVVFTLKPYQEDYYYGYDMQYADVAELLSEGRSLTIDGTATLKGSAHNLSGTMAGAFRLFNVDLRWGGKPVARCESAGHQVVLTQ